MYVMLTGWARAPVPVVLTPAGSVSLTLALKYCAMQGCAFAMLE
jgi:hypothetical protein